MKITQSNYRRGSSKRNKSIVCRLTEEEFKTIKRMADRMTGGNVSDLIRLTFLRHGKKEAK